MSTRLEHRVLAKTASFTIPGDRSYAPGTVITNRGATGSVTATLPTPGSGLKGHWYIFWLHANQSFIVAAPSTNTLVTIGDATADNVGFQISNKKVGRAIYAECDGTSWFACPFGSADGFCIDGTEVSPAASLTLPTVNGAVLNATGDELDVLDDVTAGTFAASKGMVLDASGHGVMPDNGILALSRGTAAAAGSGASDATALTDQIAIVTGADNAKGVALPAAATTTGPFLVINDAAARLLVYPVNGGNDNINGLAEDAAFTLAGGEWALFIPTSATQWYTATRGAQAEPSPRARTTVANAGTVAAADLRGRVLFQDASGGNVTMTTRTGTQIAADLPEMRVGDSILFHVASNHATNTSTISGGTDVTLVGSGAVTNTGGSFLLIKTAATTFDLVRVG